MIRQGNKKKVSKEAGQTNGLVKQALIEKRLLRGKMKKKRFTL